MIIRALSLFVIGLGIVGCSDEAANAQIRHKRAVTRFVSFVKGESKGSRDEIRECFYECFPKGMDANNVQKALATARSKHDRGGGRVEYSWDLDKIDHSWWLVVAIQGDPPVVHMAEIRILPGA